MPRKNDCKSERTQFAVRSRRPEKAETEAVRTNNNSFDESSDSIMNKANYEPRAMKGFGFSIRLRYRF